MMSSGQGEADRLRYGRSTAVKVKKITIRVKKIPRKVDISKLSPGQKREYTAAYAEAARLADQRASALRNAETAYKRYDEATGNRHVAEAKRLGDQMDTKVRRAQYIAAHPEGGK